ncbi:TIGR02642 family protein [Pectobacterium sp. CHL-2024]|uniref:TIGR02642 family protein n=1 Tax=Pectobacterium sp. CHL-2024 TaxID=3377079 RepID=UPI003807F2A0
MTIAIEQLIKMHDPRCMSIESLNVGRGRAVISKEQILAAFATTQHRHSIGFDLLMAKYRHDRQAEQRVRAAISNWVNTPNHLMHSDPACQLALNMVLERNLPAQIDHIAGLLRRYGTKAAQSRKNTDALRAEIKRLERQRCREKVRHADYISAGIEIAELNDRIGYERKALREWSERQAAQLNVCPRCNGTGKTLRPAIAVCNECGGNGHIAATFEHLRKSLTIIGTVISASEWPQYLDLVKRCMHWLYIEESQAVSALSTKIHDEMEA